MAVTLLSWIWEQSESRSVIPLRPLRWSSASCLFFITFGHQWKKRVQPCERKDGRGCFTAHTLTTDADRVGYERSHHFPLKDDKLQKPYTVSMTFSLSLELDRKENVNTKLSLWGHGGAPALKWVHFHLNSKELHIIQVASWGVL